MFCISKLNEFYSYIWLRLIPSKRNTTCVSMNKDLKNNFAKHYLPKLKMMWYARHKWCSVHNSPRIALMLKLQFNENPNWSPNIGNIMLCIDYSTYNFNHEIQMSESLICIKLIMKPWNDNRFSRCHNWKQNHEAKVNTQ